MPTYSFQCAQCKAVQDAVMSISTYCDNPPAFFHCGERMERFFQFDASAALSNALAGDRHYDGLTATDGTDISTRAKHRAYMKAKGLTTADDFAQTWKKDAAERQARMAGHDPSRVSDVAQAFAKHRR